jgi:hypothetical protein
MCVTVTAKQGKSKTARALVDLMILRGMVLDVKTYNALLPAILSEAPSFLQVKYTHTHTHTHTHPIIKKHVATHNIWK